MASYAELVAQGKIKSFHNRSSINQPGLNEIAGDNERGENALTEAQILTKNNAINFTHGFNSVGSLDHDYSLNFTYSNDSFTPNSLNFSANSSKISLDTTRTLAEQIFIKEIIKPSIQREQQTVGFLRSNVSSTLSSRDDVLNFFNNKTSKPLKIPTILDVAKDMENRYTNFVNAGSNPTAEDFQKLSSTILKDYENLKKVLEQKVLDFPQFVGYWNTFLGSMGKLTGTKASPDLFQMSRSGTTFLEIVEMANLEIKQSSLALDPNEVKITIESTGSGKKDFFANYIQQYQDKNSIQDLTLKDYEQILINMYKEYPELLISSKGIERDIFALSQTLGQWSGSKTDKTVADLAFIIESKTSGTRKVFIDAKLSSDQAGRYSPSGGIQSNSIVNVLNNSLSPILAKEVKFRLELFLSYTLYLLLNTSVPDKYFEGKNINALLTYAILGSTDFIDHYRQYTAEDSSGFQQPDLLLLGAGYIWYSDFFRLISYIYFQSSSTRSGSKVSMDIADNIDKLLTPFQSIIESIQKKEIALKSLEDLKSLNILDEQILRYFNTFLNSNIKLKIDIKKFMSTYNQMPKDYAK